MLKLVNNRVAPGISRSQLTYNFIINSFDSVFLRHTTPLVFCYFYSQNFHHIFTNTGPISSALVCNSSSIVAHTKSYNCWIDKTFFLKSYSNYHIHKKCKSFSCISANNLLNRTFVSLENSKKMVWITDLDNPEV